ncbi:MAG: deoxyguanosinetriphosphate triphosphohydrolase [Pseudomonadota bacterium]
MPDDGDTAVGETPPSGERAGTMAFGAPAPSLFGVWPEASRGRLHAEAESLHRSPFQRDRDRILHSSAFRRLKHKTQVFVEHEGDYFRTRLTHSLEVAQIARTVARVFGLNEDLAEAVALAHDLGHTPFGHTGEDALAECMQAHGGYDHNAQALKIVTEIEGHYAAFDGLNLSWETLEGIAKHNGPLLPTADGAALHYVIAEYDARHPLRLDTYASAEAQVAALSDDIAYVNHDLADGMRAGVFAEADAETLPILDACYREVDAAWPGISAKKRRYEALRRVFGRMVDDLLEETGRRLDSLTADASLDTSGADVVRHAGMPVVAFSAAMWGDIQTIKGFLFHRMYRHTRVRRMRLKATRVVRELFEAFMADPGLMPEHWYLAAQDASEETARARIIGDYIAGMTDRYALEEHRVLTDPSAVPH